LKIDRKKLIKFFCLVCFLIYLIILIYLLIFYEEYDRTMANRSYRYNLIPFAEIRRFWVYRKQIGISQVISNLAGNVVGFLPFGMLLPAFSRRFRSAGLIAFLSFDVSLCVELIQLTFKVGIFDVDDIMMNTLGGLIGYGIFVILYYGRLIYNGTKEKK
jgi:glycopeptide antibiotics resistance protein